MIVIELWADGLIALGFEHHMRTRSVPSKNGFCQHNQVLVDLDKSFVSVLRKSLKL